MLLPIRIVIAWFVAVAVHELFHYFVLRLCGLNVRCIVISATGVKIQVNELQGFTEIVSALAGPLGGATLLLLRRWLPYAAILGAAHSCVNLLPIGSLDGGRAMRAILVKLLGSQVGVLVYRLLSYIFLAILIVLGICLCLHLHLSFLTVLIVCIFFTSKLIRKFPCKPTKQIVQ